MQWNHGPGALFTDVIELRRQGLEIGDQDSKLRKGVAGIRHYLQPQI